MSYSLDANVLLYASDESGPYHEPASAFLRRCAHNPEPLFLCWPTVMAYLRIATHPSVFGRPLTPVAANTNVASLLALPQVRMIGERDGFWERYLVVTDGISARGNLVPDAHVATLLVQHDVAVFYTRDSDFRRFDALRVRDPFC